MKGFFGLTFATLTIAVLATGATIATPAGATDLDELCEDAEPESVTEVAGLSNVDFSRDPTDLTGARLIGCLHNLSDEPIPNMMLGFDQIQERGSGGGNTDLDFHEIEPGEVTPFRSSPFTRDREHYEDWEVSGIKLTELERFGDDSWALDEPIELPLPLVDRPKHSLEAECARLDPDEGEGEVWISQAGFHETRPTGVTYVVGCVTNRGEETLADGMDPEIGVQYSGRYGEEPERMGSRGGTGNLELEEPLEPGETAFFVTSFEFEDPLLEVTIEPGGMEEVDGAFDFVASGPAAELERGLED